MTDSEEVTFLGDAKNVFVLCDFPKVEATFNEFLWIYLIARILSCNNFTLL